MVSSTEHVAAVVADVLGELSATFRDTQLLKEILREMGRLNVAESKDTSGISNASKFLVRVAESAPRDVLANLAVLLPHLDGPSYTLRSGIVTAMGTIVSKVFPQDAAPSPQSNGEDEAKTASLSARDTLLDVLQERVRDVHANTRGAVLKSLASLCSEGALPLDRLHGIAAIAVDRLRDKTSTVRSAAMQLVAALLETSPFGTSLNLNAFLQMQEAEEMWLKQRREQMQLAPAMAAGDEEEDGPAAAAQEDSEEGQEEADLAHANARAYLAAAVKFCEQLSAAVPVICQLMGSSTKTEVNEAIRFMSRARSYGLPGLKDGLQRMLTLIWSSEQSIREEVVENFTSMYFTRLSDDGKKAVAQQPQIIAINLVALMSGASLAVTTSLEEIMATITKAGTIDSHLIKALWELVALPLQQSPKAHKDNTLHEKQLVIARGAMNLLAMIARADSDSVNTPAGLTKIREVLTSSYDLRLARHACSAVQCLVDCGTASPAKAKLLDEMLALAVQLVRG
jgi:condensin complex subunit 1